MGQQSLALKVRQFIRELLGSRLLVEIEVANAAIVQQLNVRLDERSELIADLREQLAQSRATVARYEMILIPLTDKQGNLLNARPAPVLEPLSEPTGWHAIQVQWDRKQAADAAEEARQKSEVNNVRREQSTAETA